MKLLVPLALALSLIAQERPVGPPTVQAHGTATVTAQPDQVKINIGVVTQAQTAQAAAAANAKQLTAVLADLKRVVGERGEIETTSYTVHPNYKYSRDGGNPTIVSYTATNVVQVTSPDISAAGKIIDAATQEGANRIQGVRFTLKNEQAVRAQALQQASKQARQNADAMAAALGLKVQRIVSVQDTAPVQVHPVREMMQMRAAAADAPPTPIEPGTIEVSATVTVTAEVAP